MNGNELHIDGFKRRTAPCCRGPSRACSSSTSSAGSPNEARAASSFRPRPGKDGAEDDAEPNAEPFEAFGSGSPQHVRPASSLVQYDGYGNAVPQRAVNALPGQNEA